MQAGSRNSGKNLEPSLLARDGSPIRLLFPAGGGNRPTTRPQPGRKTMEKDQNKGLCGIKKIWFRYLTFLDVSKPYATGKRLKRIIIISIAVTSPPVAVGVFYLLHPVRMEVFCIVFIGISSFFSTWGVILLCRQFLYRFCLKIQAIQARAHRPSLPPGQGARR